MNTGELDPLQSALILLLCAAADPPGANFVVDLCSGTSVRCADQLQHLTGWPPHVSSVLLSLIGALVTQRWLSQRSSWQ